jgi:glycogen debranching enzyme
MRVRATPAPDAVDVAAGGLSWHLDLPAGDTVAVRLHAAAERGDDARQAQQAGSSRGRQFAGTDRVPWSRPEVTCADPSVAPAVLRGLDDLEGLLLEDTVGGRGDLFAAAGTPWFLTLFGRDSLWTARMLMPLGTDLATSTLRALARRQGERDDPHTGEQPGRILHEVRAETLALDTVTLPPTYYGTADATQLFVICCAEAWRWGADPAEIDDLLPAVERALGWMERQAGEGFIRYVDTTGDGLANQGWKDSKEGVQWADGSLVEPPVALSEVQGYAYQAAMLGADLLDGFDRPGVDRWRAWARALAERFRAAFWVQDAAGRYPAIALDRDGAAADSVASNMGHLLGTGLLDAEETALVAERLSSPDLDSGFGLRTLTAASPRYSPLSYHGGSVWPHDTAIAVAGLARAGFGAEAAALVEGLFRAARHFDFRLPELYGGDRGGPVRGPMPYPAACRPQAWSAAAPLSGLVALLGLDVDVPAGTLTASPALPDSLRPLTLTGLRLGRHALDVSVDAAGRVSLETDRPGLRHG